AYFDSIFSSLGLSIIVSRDAYLRHPFNQYFRWIFWNISYESDVFPELPHIHYYVAVLYR
ncbi:hypothetical protein, partial [Photorhabdus luminescens]|uniref:hypothetical protein n=1 Tax=Photorhabdus luminescens TaxID=29488 RepID=UPI001EFFD039